jgi:nicotinamide mononucleotide transporter
MFLGSSYLEWAAVLTTALCIFLAGRNNVHTWWTGIVACVLFGFLFYDAKLYADVTLQGFFVITGFIGWANWIWAKSTPKGFEHFLDSGPLPLSKVPKRTLILYGVIGLIVTAVYSAILVKYTDAAAPIVDSMVLTLSVVAQLMLMRRQLETWPTWLAVNILSVPLYFSRELYLTAGLYAFCLVNAVISWRHWLNLYDDQTTPKCCGPNTLKILGEP